MSLAKEFTEEDEKRSRKESDNGEDNSPRLALKPPSFFGRIGQFYHDVKLEMRKTSWPTRSEVWSTTVVVLVAVVFFGFYLWGVDYLVTLGFQQLEKVFR
ncbi:MAG: preprotein translocase subunit SecE [Acidobacteria bacterium]|nr:preprotein translocase subunit SecE [Acidobacteriota bacterium]